MPRPIITSNFTPRSKPTSNWGLPRGVENPFRFDSTDFTFDSTGWTFDMTARITSDMDRPRYASLLLNSEGQKILQNEGNPILLNGIEESNIIRPNWH